jgi:hypothetical protein
MTGTMRLGITSSEDYVQYGKLPKLPSYAIARHEYIVTIACRDDFQPFKPLHYSERVPGLRRIKLGERVSCDHTRDLMWKWRHTL